MAKSLKQSEPAADADATLTRTDIEMLRELQVLFRRFQAALDIFCSTPTQHPLRRRSDLINLGTASDMQTAEQVTASRDTKAVWAAKPATVAPPKTRAIGARVVYRPIRRTYRGRAVQPDLSELQPVVRKVYDAVIKAPGLRADRYDAMTKMNKNTVRYALQILRQMKLVESTPANA